MEHLDWWKLLGGSATIGSLLVFGIKWIVTGWTDKNKEIETLRAQNQTTALNRFNEDVKNFRIAIDTIQTEIKGLNDNLILNRKESIQLKTDLAETKKLLSQYMANVDEKVRNMIKTEVTNLTQQLMLIRNKNNGK